MQPGDRLICTFIQPMPVGAMFTEWPLHITIIPWFRVNVSTEQLTGELQGALSSVDGFTVVLDGEARFGRKGSKLVHLVAEPTLLRGIEHQVRTMLHQHGVWIVDESTKSRQHFRPHVTDQKQIHAQAGDTFLCSGVYIVEQQGSQKVIAGKVELSNEQ